MRGSRQSAVKLKTYDAIVIGSGITGGWAAKELCERGFETLLLERGRMVEHIKDYPTAQLHSWEMGHRGELSREERERHHVQTRHYSISGENSHFYVDDRENPYTEIHRYDWIRTDVFGGRSLLWARMSLRWSDLDFEANLRDGTAPDWPIRYRDLAPWYEHVERFIGISGSREAIPHLPDSVFQAPMQMNCLESDFKDRIEKRFPGRRVIHPRVANLTERLPGREPCQYRNLCSRGCPYGAYFSTQSSTYPAALATGRLTVRTHALANRILYDADKGRATGVEFIDTNDGKTYEYKARLIFLNASTLGSTHLLLNSKSRRFPNGMGNDSDQLGRNLMDHHKSGSVRGWTEAFGDRYYFGRRPGGLFIPRYVNVNSQEKDYLRGFNCQSGTSRVADRGGAGIGAPLKKTASEPGPWVMSLSAFGECLPRPENRVTLNNDRLDKWGRPTLSIDCRFGDNEKRMRDDAVTDMMEMLESAGMKDIRLTGEMSFPGNANHEMGTVRMGTDPKNSVLNRWNQLHAVPNVLVTDGSCMASSASVNPSLTYMALTARAVDHAASEMRKGNI